METEITKKELKEIIKYVSSGELVKNMNDNGLSVSAMAIIIDTLFTKIDEIKIAMEELDGLQC